MSYNIRTTPRPNHNNEVHMYRLRCILRCSFQVKGRESAAPKGKIVQNMENLLEFDLDI